MLLVIVTRVALAKSCLLTLLRRSLEFICPKLHKAEKLECIKRQSKEREATTEQKKRKKVLKINRGRCEKEFGGRAIDQIYHSENFGLWNEFEKILVTIQSCLKIQFYYYYCYDFLTLALICRSIFTSYPVLSEVPQSWHLGLLFNLFIYLWYHVNFKSSPFFADDYWHELCKALVMLKDCTTNLW